MFEVIVCFSVSLIIVFCYKIEGKLFEKKMDEIFICIDIGNKIKLEYILLVFERYR